MNRQNSRRVALDLPLWAPVLILLCMVIWACVGVSLAYAGIGVPGGQEETALGTEVEPMPTHVSLVYWSLTYENANTTGEVDIRVGPGGSTIEAQRFSVFPESSPRTVGGTLLVPAGDKFALERKGVAFSETRIRYTVQEDEPSGAEGKEGPEGKEGKEGKEGPKGETGAMGSGGGGGGGEGETKVASFGTTAEATLSEFKESMETVGWCIIGTMLALALGFWLMKTFRVER